MGTTADKLAYLSATKDTLKTNLTAKGVEVPEGTTFRQMAEKVGDIQTGGSFSGYKQVDTWAEWESQSVSGKSCFIILRNSHGTEFLLSNLGDNLTLEIPPHGLDATPFFYQILKAAIDDINYEHLFIVEIIQSPIQMWVVLHECDTDTESIITQIQVFADGETEVPSVTAEYYVKA